MGTHDFQWMGDRVARLLGGGSPMADTLLENASLRARIAALESQLADRDAEIERLEGELRAELTMARLRIQIPTCASDDGE